MKLLDTNVFIHYLKGDPAIVKHIQSASRGELAISTIAIYQLEFGTLKSRISDRRRRDLDTGLGNLEHVPFDYPAAMAAAAIRMELDKRRSPIAPLDILIAGTALSRGAALVTNNVAEFTRVRGLRVLDWRSA